MSFDELGHQSVQRSPAGGNELKDLFALSVAIERPLDRIDLPTNAPDSR